VRRGVAGLVVAVLVAASGCTSEGPGGGAGGGGAASTTTGGPTDRVSVITGVATRVIAPAYRSFASAAAELEATTATCSLERSRTAWREARLAYMKTLPAQGLAPSREQRLPQAVDFWPADPAGIEAFVAGPGPFTVEVVADLGARLRGFHALEILLFGQGFFDEGRCKVANLVSVLIRRAADGVAAAWDKLAPGFGTQDRALAEVVSTATQAISFVEGEMLGMPYGLRRGATVNPALVRGRNTLADAAAAMDGTAEVIDVGVLPLLTPELAGRVKTSLIAAQEAVEGVPTPLEIAVVNARPKVLAGTQACKVTEQLMATEVVSVLGITLNFNPNDGD
jgi:predicted lipoprotein